MQKINIKFEPKDGNEEKLRKVFHKYGISFFTNLEEEGIAYATGTEIAINSLMQQVRKEGVCFIITDDLSITLTEHQKNNYLAFINHLDWDVLKIFDFKSD